MAEALTHRRILGISLPIVLSNVTVPLLGLVDTGVVGQLGAPEPIAAVGVGAIILATVFWFFGFLRMGLTGLAAQAVGAGDKAEVQALLIRGLIFGAGAGLALIVLQPQIFALGFWLTPASAEVKTLAAQYMGVRIWSAPAAIAGYAITGWLVACERTRSVMALQLVMNGVNIVLSILFVLHFDMGVVGVAFATAIAEVIGLGLGLWFCRDGLRRPDSGWDWAMIRDPERLRVIMAVNADIFIRSAVLMFVFTSFLLVGGRYGDVTLAANQVLLQFVYITSYALDGYAFAAETLVGQALGARNRKYLRRTVVLSGQWTMGTCVALSLVFWAQGGGIVDMLTTAEDVRAEARLYLPYMVLAPVLGAAAWLLDGVFIGATRTADMRNMMLLSGAIYLVAFLILPIWFGNHGLWMALLVSLLARGVTLGWRYPALEQSANGP